MRSKKHIILLILGLAGIKLLITCVAGVLIFRGCGELIELSTRNSVYKDLGNNFEYRFSWPLIRDKSDSIWISPKVKNFMFNDKFIVAQQHYKGENSSANFDIKDPHCYSGDDTDTYYWIIDKQNVRRYGPMDYERFQNLCDSLNVGLDYENEFDREYYDHEDLGADYKYFAAYKRISHRLYSVGHIPPKVEEYKFDDRFIVAKEVLNGRMPRPFYKMKCSDYYLGFDTTYYWIIDKNDTIRYGPMDYGRFQSLCDSLNVGLSL